MDDLVQDYDWLRANHKMVHYFGLGFIQLKIDDSRRMHFYTSELPPITPEEDVHNHRYNFVSHILKGRFYQELFKTVDGSTHTLEKESCQAGVDVPHEGTSCGLVQMSRHHYTAGDSYWLHHDTFHRVSAENCITFVERSEYQKELAEVIRAIDSPKICPFSQKVPEENLWEIIERMLKE